MSASGEITRLLVDWRGGDQGALDRVLPLVYDELRRVARSHMRREQPDHLLQTTALVHEASLRLIDQKNVRWEVHELSGQREQRVGPDLEQDGRSREAEPLLREALAIQKRKADRPNDVGIALRYLGECLLTQKRYDEAEPLLTESAQISSVCTSRKAP